MASPTSQPAAVSASEAVFPGPEAHLAAAPVAGPYEGATEGPSPSGIEFRFLGGGIRDLRLDGRMLAQWVPVRGYAARASLRGAEIRLTWDGPREVRGTVVRRRRGRTEVARFTARHRFRGLLR